MRGGLNTYGYVGGNPVNYIDPDGKIALIPAAIGVGLFVGTVQGYINADNGGSFIDGFISGFGFGFTATAVGALTGVYSGIIAGLGVELLFSGGSVANILFPPASGATLDNLCN